MVRRRPRPLLSRCCWTSSLTFEDHDGPSFLIRGRWHSKRDGCWDCGPTLVEHSGFGLYGSVAFNQPFYQVDRGGWHVSIRWRAAVACLGYGELCGQPRYCRSEWTSFSG